MWKCTGKSRGKSSWSPLDKGGTEGAEQSTISAIFGISMEITYSGPVPIILVSSPMLHSAFVHDHYIRIERNTAYLQQTIITLADLFRIKPFYLQPFTRVFRLSFLLEIDFVEPSAVRFYALLDQFTIAMNVDMKVLVKL
jgi:hypothetical protein